MGDARWAIAKEGCAEGACPLDELSQRSEYSRVVRDEMSRREMWGEEEKMEGTLVLGSADSRVTWGTGKSRMGGKMAKTNGQVKTETKA